MQQLSLVTMHTLQKYLAIYHHRHFPTRNNVLHFPTQHILFIFCIDFPQNLLSPNTISFRIKLSGTKNPSHQTTASKSGKPTTGCYGKISQGKVQKTLFTISTARQISSRDPSITTMRNCMGLSSRTNYNRDQAFEVCQYK